MSGYITRFIAGLLLLAALTLVIFGRRPAALRLPDAQGRPTGPVVAGRTVVTYWEKWTRDEAQAMRDVVNRFNLAQDEIFINMVSVSQINQKLLIATAGGDPPDIAGLWAAQMGPFMHSRAIEPLDELTADGTVTEKTYKPYVWRICAPGGRLYAAAATPSTCALYWNKDLFAAAGLDPEKPPRTIEELDAMAERLTVRENGTIRRSGFLPHEPVWWDYSWGIYWGNSLWNPETGRFNLDTPEQRAAYAWFQGYTKKYGVADVDSFASGFGEFNSPQNAFISGQVAMVVQGPFFAQFIRRNNPALAGHYGVALMPLPKGKGEPGDVVLGDLDCWVIPRHARHKAAALKALKFFTQRENMEYLCQKHGKPSPLTEVSADFLEKNPHPYIGVFEQTMRAKRTESPPASPVWERVRNDIIVETANIWRGAPVEQTLQRLQENADRFVAEWRHNNTVRSAGAGGEGEK